MSAEGQANAATAQTLNYALGNLGGRQKSWMIESSNTTPGHNTQPARPLPAQRRGRPRKQPAPRPSNQLPPQAVASAGPPIDTHADRQPSSKSTSPLLANTVTQHDIANRRASRVTVFPSPTPSEENVHLAPATTTRDGENAARSNVDFLEFGSDPAFAHYAPNTPLETVFMDAASKRAAEGSAPIADKRPRQERPTPPAATAGQPPPQLPANSSGPAVSPISRSPSLVQQANAQIPSHQLPRGTQLRDVLIGRTPPQVQAPFGPPRTLSRGMVQHPFSVPAETGPTTPPQSCYSVHTCLHTLKTFQESNLLSPQHPRDGLRLAVLGEATRCQDWPYLALHQYYCMLNYKPNVLPTRFLHHPNLHQVVGVMQKVLDTNDMLSPAVLAFFCNFPRPLEEIAANWPSEFQHHADIFRSFMTCSPNHIHLELLCETRGFPPIARELAVELRIASPTFQRLTFTAFLRSIWRASPLDPPQAQFEAQVVDLFKQNQAHYLQQEALTGNVELFTPEKYIQEKNSELRLWGPQFKRLVDEFKSTFTTQHTAVPQHSQSPRYIEPQHHLSLGAPSTEMAPRPVATRPVRPVDQHTAQAGIQQTRGRGHPPMRPVPNPRVLPSQAPRQQRRSVPLLPQPGWTQPQQRQPNPARFSLHQAHLRSPVLQAHTITSPLYLYMIGCILPPVRLATAGRAIEKFTFTMTSNDMQMIPKAVPSEPGGPDVRSVNDKSRLVRIRCIKRPSTEVLSEQTWAVADTAWVPYSYITFNGKSLQQRKKVHNGRDLPIEITGLLREGVNELAIAVMAQSSDTSYRNYLIGVEALGVQSHEDIKRHCVTEKHVSAEQVVEGIKKKLSGTGDDDEICVVESNLTINLFDPFSASKMCDIPVRGTACLHNDCFDLETFLQTRRRKGDTSVADQWRCPICNADARPCELLVDGFIEDVRKTLAAQGLLHTRAIIVQQDGSWKPKAEVRDPNGVSDDPPTPTAAAQPAPADVIDLSGSQ